MATKISAVMTFTDQANKQASRSITDISPTATAFQIKDFAVALNALTNNTLDGVELVTKEDITGAQALIDPNLSINPTEKSIENFSNRGATTLTVSYSGNTRKLTVTGKKPSGGYVEVMSDRKRISINGGVNEYVPSVSPSGNYPKMTITLAADETYAESSIDFTYTGGDNSSTSDIPS